MTQLQEDKQVYATVTEDEGVNYRDISEVLTLMGYPMNHSSARNHVLRVMKKFVEALAEEWNVEMTEERTWEIARSASFQAGIADILHSIEGDRLERS